MAGIVFKSPGVFAGADDMPRISVARPSPASGAIADWAADQLPLGLVSVWPSMVGDYAFTDPGNNISQRPNVIGEGVDRYVSFDGVDDRVDVDMAVNTPFTVALVARLPQMAASQYIMSPGSHTNGVSVSVDSAGGSWLASNGSFRSFQTAADTAWHVFVAAFDGADSYLMIDDTEVGPVSPGSNGIGRIRLGASATAYSPSDVKRLTVLPNAAGPTERRTIRAVYGDLYGI